MKVTAEILSEIKRLNRAGFNDMAISEALGLKYGTVRYNRQKDGLASNAKGFSDRRIKRYCVYDAKTTEFIVEGPAAECAARLGKSVNAFHVIATKFRKGQTHKWEIYPAEAVDAAYDAN